MIVYAEFNVCRSSTVLKNVPKSRFEIIWVKVWVHAVITGEMWFSK